jgi:nucleoid DNA-binding protein
MTFKEILAEIKAKRPELLGDGLSDEKAILLLRTAFRVVGGRLRREKDGRVPIQGLGTFRVRSVARGEGRDRVSRRMVSFKSRQEADRLPE